MPTPDIDLFKRTATEFYEKWDFPNCVRSIDGKHIRLRCPKNSGSMYFNYKQFFSIVLMAVAPCVFIGDEAFPLRNYMMRPFPRKQSQENDKAYNNYRLFPTRMTVECAFGIMSSKFRILLKSIETTEKNADHIVKAIYMLHNTIIGLEQDVSIQNVPESINTNLHAVHNQMIVLNHGRRANNHASRTAIGIRNNFVNFFIENKI